MKSVWFLTPLLLASGCIGPIASSDVPVTHKIGWFCQQDDLTITNFNVETVGTTNFGFLSDSRTLARIHISGTMKHENGLQPYISQVQIAEFFESANAASDAMVADVRVTPVVDTHLFSRPVSPSPVAFDLKVEKVLATYKWGENIYRFRCGDFEKKVTLFQGK